MIEVSATRPAAHLPRGATLGGRYIVSSILRDDGSSTLYLGLAGYVRAEAVMIKEIAPEGFASADDRTAAQQRFAREVQVLKDVRHPALPVVLDAFSESGRYYLVMRHFAGETLEAMLERRQHPFAEDDVVGWALDILSALGPMHRHAPPVIYRNLKPAGLVIDPTGTLRLLDFGLARFFRPGKGRDTAPIGSVGYAPPEQFGGSTDPRTDLYALGVTMYHLLTRMHPALYPPGVLPPATCNPAVSAELAAIVTRATDLDPNRRWASAMEMEAALRRHALSRSATRTRLRGTGGGGPAALPAADTPASTARLVIMTNRLSSGRDEIIRHLMRLTWMTPEQVEMALATVPAVVPLVEPHKSSLQILKGLGVDVRPVWPLRGLRVLDEETAQALETHGRATVYDPTACEDGVCLCRHCLFGWIVDHSDAAPPGRCPSCGREGWNTTILRWCRWCGHEYDENGSGGTCPCCGLAQEQLVAGQLRSWY